MMPSKRPNPFTSLEGCLLSQTLWAVMVLLGFFGGAFLGKELGQGMQDTTIGGLMGMTLLGFMPWRRWLAAWLRPNSSAANPHDRPLLGSRAETSGLVRIRYRLPG